MPLFKKEVSSPDKEISTHELSLEKRAQHEAAHGIVWYLFKEFWTVNTLTIDPLGLPDERMNGALHISPKFNGRTELNTQRINEISAIALAGMIGQNIDLIRQRNMITIEIAKVYHFSMILDTTGCSGDMEIINTYIDYLSQEFGIKKYSYVKYKIMDLISLFQDHKFVQQIHSELTQMLLVNRSINGTDLITFFEMKSYQKYVEDNNLNVCFFNNL